MLIDTNDVRMYDLNTACEKMKQKGHPISPSDLVMALSELMDWMESEERQKMKDDYLLAKYEYEMKYGRV